VRALSKQPRVRSSLLLLGALVLNGCAMQMAVKRGDIEEVKRLMAKGEDIRGALPYGRSYLHLAAEAGQVEMMQFLMDQGLDVKASDRGGGPPTWWAIRRGHREAVEFLIEKGADLKSHDFVTHALEREEPDIALLLLDKGAHFESKALYHAAINGHAEVAAALIRKGVDINATFDERGHKITALECALAKEHPDVARLILEQNPDAKTLNSKEGFTKCTPLCLAVEKGYTNVVKLLLGKGADPNITIQKYRLGDGVTPLFCAIEKGHPELVPLLLEKGADPNVQVKDNWNVVPLVRAVENGYADIVPLLLEKGADPNVRSRSNKTPLQLAANNGSFDVVGMLIRHGATPDVATYGGRTVREQLLTPRGLRTLAPEDPAYHGVYEGGPAERDAAYHQGTVWPWLLGPYVDAVFAVDDAPKACAETSRIFEGLFDAMDEAGLGQISEIADAGPPHRPRGCIAQAWSVASAIHIWRRLETPQ